jgi:hypothetical protein
MKKINYLVRAKGSVMNSLKLRKKKREKAMKSSKLNTKNGIMI